MSTSGTGIVLCRLAAIFYLVQSIQGFGFYLQQLRLSPLVGSGFVEAAVVSALVPLIAALVVWVNAERISTIKGVSVDTTLANDLDTDRLVLVGTFLMGLFLFLLGIEGAARTEVAFWMQDSLNGNEMSGGNAWQNRAPTRVSYSAELLFGVLLMFGKDLVRRFFRWARYSGTSAS